MEKEEMIELSKIDVFLKKGEFLKAQRMIEDLLDQNLPDESIILSLNLLRGRLFVKQGQFEESLIVLEDLLNKSRENKNKLSEIDILITLAEASWRKGSLKKSLIYLEKCEKLLSSFSNIDKEAYIQRMGDLLFQRGVTLMRKGELNVGIETLNDSLSYRKQTKDPHRVGETLNSIGVAYFYKGLLDYALDNYKSSLMIKEELGNKQQIAITLNNIGDVLHTQGDLNQASSYYKRSLELFKEIGNKEHIASGLHNIGKFYHEQGNYDKAIKYFEDALTIVEKLGNPLIASENFYHLIIVSLDKNDLNLVQRNFQHLENLNRQTDNRVIKQRYEVAKALILKTKKRIIDKIEAMDLLRKVMQGEIINYELTITAMLHLCHLLIFELQVMGGDDRVLSELKDIAGNLKRIAEDQRLHSLLAESYILHSRLALIDLDFSLAKQFLSQALMISEKRRLKKLTNTISHELELLLSLRADWEKIFTKQPKVNEIAELSLISDLISRMIHKKVYRSEEEIRNYVNEVKHLVSTWEGA